ASSAANPSYWPTFRTLPKFWRSSMPWCAPLSTPSRPNWHGRVIPPRSSRRSTRGTCQARCRSSARRCASRRNSARYDTPARSPRARILLRHPHRSAQFLRRATRKVGVAQELARHFDQVGISAPQDVLRLVRVGDQAHRGRRDACFTTNARGERYLVTRTNRNLRVRYRAAGRHIDDIDAIVAQYARELHALVDVPAAFGPIGSRQTHP